MQPEDFRRLLRGRKIGKGKWICKCPAHSDKTASLSITAMKTGTRLHCFGGCSQRDVLDAMGLTHKDTRYDSDANSETWKQAKKIREEEERQAAVKREAEHQAYVARRVWEVTRICLCRLVDVKRNDDELRYWWHIAINKSLGMESNPTMAREIYSCDADYGEPEDWPDDIFADITPRQWPEKLRKAFGVKGNIRVVDNIFPQDVGPAIAKHLRLKRGRRNPLDVPSVWVEEFSLASITLER